MATILIATSIIGYSSWMLYRSFQNKKNGKCEDCTGCSLNSACPLKALAQNQDLTELKLAVKQK